MAISNRSSSFLSPPKAKTVLMADMASSTTLPALAYSSTSCAAKEVCAWKSNLLSLYECKNSSYILVRF